MRYNTISNNPNERSIVTYPFVWWDGGFTNEEVDKIADYCDSFSKIKAKISNIEQVDKIRRSEINFFQPNNDNRWIFNRMNGIVTELNNQFYGFNLNGYDAFQYTTYSSEEKGMYDWHMDIYLSDKNLPPTMVEPRKLSAILLLNEPGVDFEGGEFQIKQGVDECDETVFIKKGRVLAFPSFMLHRVAPVTKGIRKSLVIWVTGPKFI